MITAHSGCDHTQDNSLEFIKYALTLPVDAFEIDIRENTRGELVLSHDETEEDAPWLADAFRLLRAHPTMRINCDLKQKGLEEAVFSLAKELEVEDRLIFTGDVEPRLFPRGASRYPQVVWFTNLETLDPEFAVWQRSASEGEIRSRLEQVLEQMTDYETAGLNWNYPLAELVWEKAKALGIGISVWTVNDPFQQKLWLERKIDNITSRNTAELIGLTGYDKRESQWEEQEIL